MASPEQPALPVRMIVLHHFDGYTAYLKADRNRSAEGQTEDEACRNLIDSLLQDYERIKAQDQSTLAGRDKEYQSMLESIFGI